MVVSGSKNGSILVHSLRGGRYTRSITHPKGYTFDILALTPVGQIVTYVKVEFSPSFLPLFFLRHVPLCLQRDQMLHMYNTNGRLLASEMASQQITDLVITRDGKYLIAGGVKNSVTIRTLHKYDSAVACGLFFALSRYLSLTLSLSPLQLLCRAVFFVRLPLLLH